VNERTIAALARYIAAARDHGLATDEGDDLLANRSHDDLHAALRDLIEQGERRILIDLLAHEDASVRAWAATHVLPIAEARAIEVLEELTKLPGIIGFEAEMVLKEWRKGTLVLP
jgi:hypothetical protein